MLRNARTRPPDRFSALRLLAVSPTRNPAADFKPRDILAEAKEENFARVDAKELPDLLAKMEGYDGDALTRLAMRLMAYTFVRTSELIESAWTEFDLDDGRWDYSSRAHEDGHAAYRSVVSTVPGSPASAQTAHRAMEGLCSRGRRINRSP